MSSEVSVRVSNLSKCYQIYESPRDRLKQFVLPRLYHTVRRPPPDYFREFWALRDVSFEIRKGETMGIVGRNGSGKSTLLQMICGTLHPTGGRIETFGRIAALLELGSGFNPEFTGHENIYLNASILGISREETNRRYQSIIDFADIGEFINRPVKTYSSGMLMRLAFAVQAQVDPDILIVDEALAVGDARFQAKCFERLRQLKEEGASILLVSHSSEQIVTHCTHAIILNEGELIMSGAPKAVVNRYLDLLFGKQRTEVDNPFLRTVQAIPSGYNLSFTADEFASRPGYNPHEYRWGDGAAAILDYHLSVDNLPYPSVVNTGQTVTLGVSIKFFAEVSRPILGITVKNKEGVTVYGANTETLGIAEFNRVWEQGSVARIEAVFCCRLAPGDYFVSLGIASCQDGDIVPHDRRYDAIHFQVEPSRAFFGLADLSLGLSVEKII